MSTHVPFSSPQAPKDGYRRAAGSIKPSPRKQKVHAPTKSTASPLVPGSKRSPLKDRAEARKPEGAAPSSDKYAFDVVSLLEDIEQREHQDASQARSPSPRTATVSQSKFERDELAEKMSHLEQTNRTLRSSLMEQMKCRKKEEEAFMSTLISEKNKANKWIAKLHLKLEKRESLLLAWAQLAHALLSHSHLEDPAAVYEQLYETTSLVLGDKLDSLQIAPLASRPPVSPKKAKKKAKRTPQAPQAPQALQVRLLSSDDDTDRASDASPSPRKPRSVPPATPSCIAEGEDEEDRAEDRREEVPENHDHDTADNIDVLPRRKLRLDGIGGSQAAGRGESRPPDGESGEDDEGAASLSFLVLEDFSLKKRLAGLEQCLGDSAVDSVQLALDAVQGQIHGNSRAIESLLAQEARDVEQVQAAASGYAAGALAAGTPAGQTSTSSLGSSRTPAPNPSRQTAATAATVEDGGGASGAKEEPRVLSAQDHVEALPSPQEYTYDQLLQEVLRSVSSAASSSLALDETLELSSSIHRTDDMIQKLLVRRPTLQTPSSADRPLPMRDMTDSERLRLGGCLDGDQSLSLEGST